MKYSENAILNMDDVLAKKETVRRDVIMLR